MIVVDSSVWIDYFNGQPTRETDYLDVLLPSEPIAIGDLILTEVLQGFRNDGDFEFARLALTQLRVFEMLGTNRSIAAAARYRELKRIGITVRKTADVIIGSFCIDAGLPLLFADRDFEPLVTHLGLQRAEA